MVKHPRMWPLKAIILIGSSIVLLLGLAGGTLAVLLNSPKTPTGPTLSSRQATTTSFDPTALSDTQLLQSALGLSSGPQAQLLQAIAQHVQAYPPASEPALVTLLQTLDGSGSSPALHADVSPIPGRGAVWSSAADALSVPAGYQAAGSKLVSPLILDLTGTGQADVAQQNVNPHPFSFSQSHATLFDMDGDGFVDYTEWVGPGAALLVHPTSPQTITKINGHLIWHGPLSGANLLGTVGGYQNGFEHLSIFDTNHDGRISGQN